MPDDQDPLDEKGQIGTILWAVLAGIIAGSIASWLSTILFSGQIFRGPTYVGFAVGSLVTATTIVFSRRSK